MRSPEALIATRFWPVSQMKSFHSCRLDAVNHCLWHGVERVAIPPKAYDLLRFLVENPGRLITREELLKAVWPDTFVNPEILRKYIQDIRRVLGDRPDKPTFIETVPKRGYRFVAVVIDEDASEPSTLPQKTPNETNRMDSLEVAASEFWLSHSRKGFYKPAIAVLIVIAAVIAIAYLWLGQNRARAPILKDTSIAVLPFVDMSRAQDQGYFSDGLSDQLINDLAKVPGLKVVARSSSFQFREKKTTCGTSARSSESRMCWKEVCEEKAVASVSRLS